MPRELQEWLQIRSTEEAVEWGTLFRSFDTERDALAEKLRESTMPGVQMRVEHGARPRDDLSGAATLEEATETLFVDETVWPIGDIANYYIAGSGVVARRDADRAYKVDAESFMTKLLLEHLVDSMRQMRESL